VIDNVLHVLGAVVLSGFFVWAKTPWKFMAIANGLFWLGREAAQKSWHFTEINHPEWVLPTVAGGIASYVVAKFIK
jgi:hypothetical protein